MKILALFSLVFLTLQTSSQTLYKNKSGLYSFEISDKFTNQASNHERNEFIFTDKADTTSLIVNVNERLMNKINLDAFKKASNQDVEINYFNILSNPKILKRGQLNNYPNQSIFFHVTHDVKIEKENNYMMTYLFYHKGKEINFIFRTKQRRRETLFADIDKIVNSVKLL